MGNDTSNIDLKNEWKKKNRNYKSNQFLFKGL